MSDVVICKFHNEYFNLFKDLQGLEKVWPYMTPNVLTETTLNTKPNQYM